MTASKTNREKTACVIGAKPPVEFSQDVRSFLYHEITYAVAQGYSTFITGLSEGTELLATSEILKHTGVHLLCAIPRDDYGRYWTDGWKTLYQDAVSRADEIFSAGKKYSLEDALEWMVERSSLLIATTRPDEENQALALAREKGLEIHELRFTDDLYEYHRENVPQN